MRNYLLLSALLLLALPYSVFAQEDTGRITVSGWGQVYYDAAFGSESHGSNSFAVNKANVTAKGTLADRYINDAISSLSESNPRYSPMRYRKLLNSVCFKLFPISLIGNRRLDTSLAISEDALFMFTLSKEICGMRLVLQTHYVIRQREGSATRTDKPIAQLAKESFDFIHSLTKVYLWTPREYSFSLYLSRVLGSLKFLCIRITKQLRRS